MAFTVSNIGTQASAGPDSSLAVSGVGADVGTMLVVCVAAANSGASGVACTTTCSDSAGNTYTQRTQVNRTGGVADDGITLTIFTALVTSALSVGDVTVSFSPSSAQGCALMIKRYTPGGGQAASFVSAGAGAAGNGTTPSITSASITIGDAIVGAVAAETGDTITADSDTSNGSWSSQYNRDVGSGTAAAQIVTQDKPVSATATQTYNPTIGSAQDYAINYIVIRSSAPPKTVVAAAGSYAVSGASATIAVNQFHIVAANAGAYSIVGQAANPTKEKLPLYPNSVAQNPFDYIHGTDPDQFDHLEYLGLITFEIYPATDLPTHVFRIHFRDTATLFKIALDESFGYVEAKAQALLLAPRLGKLPLLYRNSTNHVIIHPGDGTFSSEDDGHFFKMYADRMTVRISNNDLEESCFHESTHTSLQSDVGGKGINYIDTPEWTAAKDADNAYITDYAATADQEDLAESALFAYTIMLHPSRLEPDLAAIQAQIPARIAFFRTVFAGHITACVRVSASSVAAKLPARFIESLEDNTSLLSHCRDIANLKVEAYYSNPDFVVAGVPDLYKFFCTVCGRVHPRYPVGSEPRPFWEVR